MGISRTTLTEVVFICEYPVLHSQKLCGQIISDLALPHVLVYAELAIFTTGRESVGFCDDVVV